MSKTEVMVVDRDNWRIAFPQSPAAEESDGAGPLTASVMMPTWKGYALIFAFVAGFGAWSAYAPLAGGAVAGGVVSPSSSRQVVQHLEGGIIRKLHIRDGDVVTEGQPLIELDPLQSRSAYEALVAQRQALLSRKARLEAERDGGTAIAFPKELFADGKPLPAAVSQREMFETRLAAHRSRGDILKQRIAQLEEQIGGFATQIASISQQLGLIQEEVRGKQKLLEQGLIPKPEALRLRRAESELMARRSEFETEILKTKQQIGETKLQIMSGDALRLDEVTTELDKTIGELTELDERIRASKDVLSRTTIAAPVSGTVINLKFKTVGGVVQRGEPVLEIVPSDDRLIIEAHVSPNDIQLVHPGQRAQIHFSAFSSRTMPRLSGIVRSASADRVTDIYGNRSYFLATVEVNREELNRLAKSVSLIPGMSADVIFITEERTLLEYLLSPVLEVLRRGMLET